MRFQLGLMTCASVGIVSYLVHDHRAQQAEIAGLHADMGSLTHALGEPRPSITVREVTREVVERPSDREVADRALPTPTESADAPSAGRAPIEATEQRVRYNTKFSDEHRDAQWASASQETAKTKLTAILPPTSELTSVECRSSMCKIETTHQDVEHYQQFAQSAFMDPSTVPWNGAFFSTGAEDPVTGRFIAVGYFVREGLGLPQLE